LKETVHSVFGVKLASDFPFTNRLVPTEGVPDLRFNRIDRRPVTEPWQSEEPAFASSLEPGEQERYFSIHLSDRYSVLRFLGSTEFYLSSGRIACYESSAARPDLTEGFFLGAVMSYWLEHSGVPVLHSCAVNVDGGAIAFLENNGAGKSCLGATFLQAGHSLMTDDVLPLRELDGEFCGIPAYPTMRMWPDQALHFVGRYEDLRPVQPGNSKRMVPIGSDSFGAFCEVPTPLTCVYLPERRDPATWGTDVEINPISPADAVMKLVQHSFIPRLVYALGWQPERLSFFARFIRRVPLRHLRYPNGLQFLPAVRDAILKDARTP